MNKVYKHTDAKKNILETASSISKTLKYIYATVSHRYKDRYPAAVLKIQTFKQFCMMFLYIIYATFPICIPFYYILVN